MAATAENTSLSPLCFSITGFSKASGIGTSTLYEDAKTGKLKTRLLGDGKRKKRLVLRDDGLEYLRSFPAGYEERGRD